MSSWRGRPQEEVSLLNPAFTSTGLWSAARGYLKTDGSGRSDALPFTLAFLVLPLVLHRQTRESLPTSTRTSVAVWASDNPLAPSRRRTERSSATKVSVRSTWSGGTE